MSSILQNCLLMEKFKSLGGYLENANSKGFTVYQKSRDSK